MENLPDPQIVKNYSKSEQLEWARQYGRKLWEKHGDDKVVREMSEAENRFNKNEAWQMVYLKKEKIPFKTNEVSSDSDFQNKLVMAVREGFIKAYEEAASN